MTPLASLFASHPKQNNIIFIYYSLAVSETLTLPELVGTCSKDSLKYSLQMKFQIDSIFMRLAF
jgi:hypothetical protein